jgi:thymidylate synthase (FAD)
MAEQINNIMESNNHSANNVKLISYSKNAFESIESIGSNESNNLEDMVAYCARVSNPANQIANENNTKLINYLIKHHHWSPFEMVSICLEINTTRDIARQILRHRSFSFQEFSQRYAIADLGCEIREARMQDTKNRQNSIETENTDLNNEWIYKQKQINQLVSETYEWALSNGIAKEQARVILPEGNTLSRLYMNGTLRSWIHYIELRSGNGTQKEHRLIAIECANVISTIFPMIMNFISH